MKDPVWFVKPKPGSPYPVDPRALGKTPQSKDYVIMEPHPTVLVDPVRYCVSCVCCSLNSASSFVFGSSCQHAQSIPARSYLFNYAECGAMTFSLIVFFYVLAILLLTFLVT